MRESPARPAGFTLIDVTVVLAVLAVLAAAITPMVLQQLVEAKTDATRREARLLHEAISRTSRRACTPSWCCG